MVRVTGTQMKVNRSTFYMPRYMSLAVLLVVFTAGRVFQCASPVFILVGLVCFYAR